MCFLAHTSMYAQSPITAPTIWTDVIEPSIAESSNLERPIIPLKYRTISADVVEMKGFLQNVPKRFSEAAESTTAILELPMPDGKMKSFKIAETAVMHADLAKKYPEIKTYAGIGIDDPSATMSLTIHSSGIRATILSNKHKTINIRPYATGMKNTCMSFFVNDLDAQDAESWECGVLEEVKEQEQNQAESSGDCKLRTYELALACTGGYAGKHGGTKNSVMDEMVSTVANLNTRLEREAGVRLELVPDNDDLIFLNAGSDPYTEGDNSAMINENQTTCNNIIGASDYDIGHLLSVTGGGLAGVGVICKDNSKARAVSGSGNPTGYYFETIVLHEMGHQFSARHTQNNDCNRTDFTAREPGSGSTIMSYAGVCAPNVQFPADDYYHAISLEQIQNYTINSTGNNCPVTQDIGNVLPSVSVGPDNTLPTDTYFELEGIYTNPDGDPQTFVWEQMDNEITTAPPVSTATGGPVFRSVEPGDDPIRVFPNIQAILDGETPEWEVLPSVNRSMNFRFNLRDIHDGIGCAHDDDVALEFWDPPSNQHFRVLEPETLITWFVGDLMPVQWTPADTDKAPVNSTGVDIFLSTDGGYTYPVLLAENVPNASGIYEVEVPNLIGTQNRIKVKGHGNYFFDISDSDFSIEEPPVPTFLFTVSPFDYLVCSEESPEVSYDLTLLSIAGFSEEVSFDVEGLPNGATVDFNPEVLTPEGIVEMTIGNLPNGEEGFFEITVNATSATESRSVMVELEIVHPGVETTKLLSPANGLGEAPLATELNWEVVPESEGYYLEIATNPSFGASIIVDTMVMDTNFMTSNLDPFTVYYWRVRGNNLCGKSDASEFFAFQTIGSYCQSFAAEDTPVQIDQQSTTWPLLDTSKIVVPIDLDVVDINISAFNITHTYVADMIGRLISPSGESIMLFHQPGFPASPFGCNRPFIDCTFDDEAEFTADDFENTCNIIPPAITGNFQTMDPLSNFLGESIQGEWQLEIQDMFIGASGGWIENWELEFCVAPPATPDLSQQALQVLKGDSQNISNTFLSTIKMDMPAAEIIYTILSLPLNGVLYINGMEAAIGDQFSQEDVDNELISYTHDDSDTDDDSFDFDVLDSENIWLAAQTFEILIVDLPSAIATLVSDIDCHDANNGQIEGQASGGLLPYEYSIDGTNFQASNVFDNLSEGIYTLIVKDGNGNTATASQVTITNPPAIMGSTSVDAYNVTVTASGGTGSLEYSYDGQNFQSNNVLVVPGPNIYGITIRDENGCELSLSAETIFTASSMQTSSISCYEGNDGALSVSVTGGAPGFEYSLNGQNFQDENVFDNLSAGTYTVTVKDAAGYAFTTNSVTLTDPPELTIFATTNDFEIIATGGGGTGNLEYSIDGQNFQSSNVFNVVNNGNYMITVRDENDCEANTSVEVSVNTLIVSVNLVNDISCHDENDGSITTTVSGGQSPYQYSIDGNNYQDSPTFDNLSAGTYTITILDNEGFTKSTNSVTITNPPLLTLSTSTNDFEITANGNGGTGNLQYSIDGQNFQSNNVFIVQGNGAYTVTVRDQNGCLATEDVTIAVNTLIVSASLVDEISCHNASDGSVEATVSGGTMPYQYSIDGQNYQDEALFENLSAGTYTITVLDAEGFTLETNEVTIVNPLALMATTTVDGYDITVNASGGTGTLFYSIDGVFYQEENVFPCNSNGSYTVIILDENQCLLNVQAEVNVAPLSAIISEEPASCFGMADGSLTVQASGGVPPYQYSLDDVNYQDEPTFDNLPAGQLSVFTKDACGFTIFNIAMVFEPLALSLSGSVLGPIITVNGDGGTLPYQYSIDGVNFQDENEFGPLDPGVYDILIVDANGCESTGNFEVTYEMMSFGNVIIGDFNCEDWLTTMEVCVNGGEAPYTYEIVPDTIIAEMVSGTCDFNLAFEIGNGTFELTVTDNLGYSVLNSLTVTQPDPLDIELTVDGNDIDVNPTGGTPPYVILVNGQDPMGPLNDLPNGTYVIEIEDSNGCTDTETVVITRTREALKDFGFEIMPNPSDGKVLLQFQNSISKDLVIKVMDELGRTVFEGQWEKTEGLEKSLDLEWLANGVYQIVLTEGEFLGSKKLVVVK